MESQKTWIQCSVKSCNKWRVVQNEIAKKYSDMPWTCSMNQDRNYNHCAIPEEEEKAPRGKKSVVTKIPFEKGEIILAKMHGYCQ